MQNENNLAGQPGTDISQNSDKPDTGTKVAERLSSKVHILTPDLTKKDAGKWMLAWQTASNVFYPNLQQLFDLFDYVLGHDAYLLGLIMKRHTAVLNKRIVYKDGDKLVPEMEPFLRGKKFRDTREYFLWCQQYGRGGLEFPAGKEYDFRAIPRKHIKTKWQRITIDQAGIDGFDYTQYANIMIIDNKDLGLLLPCARLAAFKKDAMADWAELIEIFGRPTQVIWYDAFSPQVLVELDKILAQAGSALRLKLPAGTKYEQYEISGGNSTGDLQMKFTELCNKEMAVLQLGGTETTGTSTGSGHAQSEVHYKGEQELVKAIMDYELSLLNSAKYKAILKSYGLPVTENGYFEFEGEVDIKYISEYKEVLKTAAELGLPVSKKSVYDTLALVAPATEEDTLILGKPEQEEDEPQDKPKPKRKAKRPEEDVELADLSYRERFIITMEKLYNRFFA